MKLIIEIAAGIILAWIVVIFGLPLLVRAVFNIAAGFRRWPVLSFVVLILGLLFGTLLYIDQYIPCYNRLFFGCSGPTMPHHVASHSGGVGLHTGEPIDNCRAPAMRLYINRDRRLDCERNPNYQPPPLLPPFAAPPTPGNRFRQVGGGQLSRLRARLISVA
jgi:hypothetical protein